MVLCVSISQLAPHMAASWQVSILSDISQYSAILDVFRLTALTKQPLVCNTVLMIIIIAINYMWCWIGVYVPGTVSCYQIHSAHTHM